MISNSTQVYLETLKLLIQNFTQCNEAKKRIQMVSLMEKHVIQLNQLCEDILQDHQPITFLMQLDKIEPRINKVNTFIEYLTPKKDIWITFLIQESKALLEFNAS